MSLTEIQTLLHTARVMLAGLRHEIDGVHPDTAFALGEALGMLRQAEALIRRDIADRGLSLAQRHG